MTTTTHESTLEFQLWQAFDMARGVRDIANATESVLGLLFLKLLDKYAISGDSRAETQSLYGLVLPSPTRWSVINTGRSPTALRDAVIAFDSHPENIARGLKGLFAGLGEADWRHDSKGTHTNTWIAFFDSINLNELDIISIAQAVDRLIERSAKITRFQSGEHYTSPELSRLLVQLLSPHAGAHIYDPTCGTANLLLAASAAVHIKGQDEKTLYGQEVNVGAVALARLNLLLHGVQDFSIARADTLVDPQFTLEGQLRRFDYVISNMPLGVHLNDQQVAMLKDDPFGRFTFGVSGITGDYAFIQHAIASLSDTGRAVLVTSLGPLFRGHKEGEIRRQIVEQDLLEAVITLPGEWRAGSNLPIAILILSHRKEVHRKGKTLFIYADEIQQRIRRPKGLIAGTSQGLGVDTAQRIIGAFHAFHDEHRFAAVASIHTIAERDYSLVPANYVDVFNLKSFLGGAVSWKALSSLGEVLPGTRLPHDVYEEGGLPVLRGRDIGNGHITLDELVTANPPSHLRAVTAQSGDVIVQRIGATPKAYLVPETLNGVLVGETLYVIRLAPENRGLGSYLVELFRAPIGQGILARMTGGGVGAPTLSLSDLHQLEVPIPEASVMVLLQDIANVESTIRTRLDEARQLRSRLFGIEEADRVQHELLALRTETQVLATSIIQADDLDFQIRNFYPYPLAYPYRVALAIDSASELYKEYLRLAENILAFIGVIGLIVTDKNDLLSQLNNKSLTYQALKDMWHHGISPGNWLKMLQESTRMLRSTSQPIATSLARLWWRGKKGETEIAKKFRNLVVRKNDFKHDRGPQTTVAFEEELPALRDYITMSYRAVSFLLQHPIRLVQDLDVDWNSKQVRVGTLLYQGDHPGLKREYQIVTAPLPKHKLYIEFDSNEWVPLYPLISVLYCPQCQMRETFFVDLWDGPGHRIVLKSFERGHTLDSAEPTKKPETAKRVAKDLEHWLLHRVGKRPEESLTSTLEGEDE